MIEIKKKIEKKANFTYKGMPLHVRPYGTHLNELIWKCDRFFKF